LRRSREPRALIEGNWFPFDAPAIVVARKSVSMVDLLLEFGADIDSRTSWWAGTYGVLDEVDTATADQLVARGARIDVHAAAAHDWKDELVRLIDERPERVNASGPDGQRPLHLAASIEVIDSLLASGADLELRDLDHSATAVQYAVARPDICRHLLQKGAVPDIFLASALGDKELCRNLIDIDAEVASHVIGDCPLTRKRHAKASMHIYFWKLRQCSTAVEVARESGHADLANWLLERAPARFQLVDACWCGDSNRAGFLLTAAPNLRNELTTADKQRLCDAAWTNRAEAVSLMLQSGFDPQFVGSEKMTPLNRAAFHGFDEVIATLLEADEEPPLEVKNEYGGTALDCCLFGRKHSWRTDGDYPRAVELLCEAGALIDEAWLEGDDAAVAVARSHFLRRGSGA